MADISGWQLLKGVSRSFYLSLRILPAPMRRAASLAYLLARTSDTLADTANAPVGVRLHALEQFAFALENAGNVPRWPLSLLNSVVDIRERRLLEAREDLLAAFSKLPEQEAELVREVTNIIISGQRLDLERFAEADSRNPVSLPNEETLVDYTWRVAGCVGAFWTKLGFLTLGKNFSSVSQDELLQRGITYGKGLQLVNILRDFPEDLAKGRCYLPSTDIHDRGAVLEALQSWARIAQEWVREGEGYAKALLSRRLRAASSLPATIALETLALLEQATWEDFEKRVKIPRSRVYLALVRAMF